ncbi:ELMO domain-containing protein 1-like isoform X3 [Sinocyclocheilus anshuiensis]|uniref:ELMO domain-containing protein 1-like isoform X2 n=1 Tax=Sinocyclocheilus anshuiensis TaxID=1608454 RepID=UPI0007B99F8D|nr:PREDICTED: ELMO domain-containing protein 1-like isoform X2 [Sinocyclocheilus anshuiensis]XP_016332795.1 PREDICTED: ELMO domain-containing protein 1-like isoform X3 [Sinocyclocheilus anshuiensis]
MKHFLRVLTQLLVFLYCKCLWRGLKFVIRKLTGRCELQRICYNNKPGARRTLKIESSLKCSKHELLQSAINVHPDSVEKTIDDIMSLKKINPDTNPQLGISLQACLLQIVGYRNLVVEVEKLRREPYACENPAHEEMLMKLWKELRPDSPLSGRISKQWCEIGFQGNDPKTDFRGMGLLGLHNLLYFAEHDKATALQVLHDSLQPKHRLFFFKPCSRSHLQHALLPSCTSCTHTFLFFCSCFFFIPITVMRRNVSKEEASKMSRADWDKKKFDKAIGYSFAIVGINITDLAYSLLVSGALKTHLYNVAPEIPSLVHFQQTFCYLMQEFHRFWIEEDPRDIMEFNRVRTKFHKRVLKQLKNPDMALCPHFTASDLHLVNL